MSHPYKEHKEVHPGRSRVKKLYKVGGGVHSDAVEDAAMIRKAMKDHDKQQHGGKHTDLSNIGEKSKSRMDRYARGGKVKSGKSGKKGGTKINIIVAPKSDKGADVPPSAPPIGAGGPPMPPPGPMGGPPGGPPVPGMMKRGGKAYARGGMVKMKSGADSGPGRLEKIKAYGKNAKK